MAGVWAAILAFLVAQLSVLWGRLLVDGLALALRYGPILALLAIEGLDWWAGSTAGRVRMVIKLVCIVVIALEFAGKLPAIKSAGVVKTQ